MKNFIDIKRILKAIVNALHALKLLIDDIPVPGGGGGLPEWTEVTVESNKATIPEEYSEILVIIKQVTTGIGGKILSIKEASQIFTKNQIVEALTAQNGTYIYLGAAIQKVAYYSGGYAACIIVSNESGIPQIIKHSASAGGEGSEPVTWSDATNGSVMTVFYR